MGPARARARHVGAHRIVGGLAVALLVCLAFAGLRQPTADSAAEAMAAAEALGAGETMSAAEDLGAAEATRPPAARPPTVAHTVEAGDTLSLIAQAYGTSVDAIVELNGLVDPDGLAVGEEIAVPASVEHLPAR